MDIEWDKIREFIKNKDNAAIAEAKMKVLDFMEKQADSLMKMVAPYKVLLQVRFSIMNCNSIKINQT